MIVNLLFFYYIKYPLVLPLKIVHSCVMIIVYKFVFFRRYGDRKKGTAHVFNRLRLGQGPGAYGGPADAAGRVDLV